MVEGARLERVYTAMYRRFESSRFRQEAKKTRKGVFYFFEEETRVRAQGSHGAIATSPHPLASRRYEKKTRKGVFYFFEEETRVRAQGSHGAIATSPHPLASRRYEKTHKGIFYFFEEEAKIRAQGSHGAIATKKDTTELVPFLNNIFIQP